MSVFSIIYVLKRDFFLDIRFAERWSWIFFETSVCFLQMLQMNSFFTNEYVPICFTYRNTQPSD